jgi:hypothetical protein
VLDVIANAIEEAERARGDGIGGVFGIFERDLDVGLSAEVIDFVGLGDFEDAAEAGGICEVAVVEVKAAGGLVGVLIDVVDAAGVEGRTAADDAVDSVAFGEEKFAEVGAVLAGDAGD